MFAGRSPSFSFCSSFQTSEYLYYFRISRKFYRRPFFFLLFTSKLRNIQCKFQEFYFEGHNCMLAGHRVTFAGRILFKINICSRAPDLLFEGLFMYTFGSVMYTYDCYRYKNLLVAVYGQTYVLKRIKIILINVSNTLNSILIIV